MTALTRKSILSWSMVAAAAGTLVVSGHQSLRLAAPIFGTLALGSILHAHAQQRGGWDQITSLAVLGVAAFCLLALAITGFWLVYFITGFAD